MRTMRWEYMTASDPGQLDTLGEAGWELISVVVVESREKLYLKRPGQTLSEEMTLSQRDAVLRGDGVC